MYLDHSQFDGSSRQPALDDDAALLLWSLRRLVLAWPRNHAVDAALARRYGDDAGPVAALLRCWLCALAARARRPLRFGEPPAARLTFDELTMMAAWRHACRAPLAAGDTLADLLGAPAADLVPLAALIGARLRPG